MHFDCYFYFLREWVREMNGCVDDGTAIWGKVNWRGKVEDVIGGWEEAAAMLVRSRVT